MKSLLMVVLLIGLFIDTAKSSCEVGMFTCDGDRCLPQALLCDGRTDCQDDSDEKDCSTTTETQTSTESNINQGNCPEWMYKCRNQKCIPSWWKCDSVSDCEDNSDEDDCEPVADINQTVGKCDPSRGKNQFTCVRTGSCIPVTQVCDGVAQCPDSSDELSCATPTNSPSQ